MKLLRTTTTLMASLLLFVTMTAPAAHAADIPDGEELLACAGITVGEFRRSPDIGLVSVGLRETGFGCCNLEIWQRWSFTPDSSGEYLYFYSEVQQSIFDPPFCEP